MNNFFIGIDFSKETFDATILERGKLTSEGIHAKFTNSENGSKNFLKWVFTNTGSESREDKLFCGENTGLYSMVVPKALAKEGFFFWLESPLQIHRSLGIKRGKTDKQDSLDIARYAAMHEEFAVRFKALSEQMEAVKVLYALRKGYVQERSSVQRRYAELKRTYGDNKHVKSALRHEETHLKKLKEEIKQIDCKILKLIEEDEELSESYDILTSMKGISIVNAVALIIYTYNFKRFDYDARRIASYWGVAPFERSSGTSINGTPHVSCFADRYLKSILSEAALCAMRYCPPIKVYAERLKARGKHKNIIRNNVKNKMLHILVAMMREKKRFGDMPEKNYKVV